MAKKGSCGVEKVEKNILVLLFSHILKKAHLQQLKGMQSSKLGMRGEERDLGAEPSHTPYITLLTTPPWTLV